MFPISLTTAVFTTSFVIIENKPITYVTHDSDGAWQFHTHDDWENFQDVAKIVSLGEIIKIDETVQELSAMPAGYYAVRRFIGDEWTISKSEMED